MKKVLCIILLMTMLFISIGCALPEIAGTDHDVKEVDGREAVIQNPASNKTPNKNPATNETTTSKYSNSKTTPPRDPNLYEPVYHDKYEPIPMLIEDVLRRDEFSKQYYTTTGDRYQVTFFEQVHYKINGLWKDISNSLIIWGNDYVPANEIFKPRFARVANNERLVNMNDGDYLISWTVSFGDAKAGVSAVTPSILPFDGTNLSQFREIEDATKIGAAVSSLIYENVYSDSVDIKYSVAHGKVEQYMLIDTSNGFTSYTVTLNTNGLTVQKADNNGYVFVNGENEVIFKLSTPYTEGVSADDVNVSVSQDGDIAMITYSLSETWLHDEGRSTQISIKTSFTTSYYVSNYGDTYNELGDGATQYAGPILYSDWNGSKYEDWVPYTRGR